MSSMNLATKITKYGKAPLKWNTSKTIEPKKLGWIQPDGKISFQTEQAVSEYAKNRVISALKMKQPFERSIIIDKNTIVGEINGNAEKIDMSNLLGKIECKEIIHGHISTNQLGAFPVSLDDFLFMLSQKLKSITAYNSNGEFSRLISTKKIPISYGTHATEKYSKNYAKLYPRKIRPMVEQFMHYRIGLPFGNKKMIDSFREKGVSTAQLYEIAKCEKVIMNNNSLHKMIHNFWKDIASKLNCKYETSFSNLI